MDFFKKIKNKIKQLLPSEKKVNGTTITSKPVNKFSNPEINLKSNTMSNYSYGIGGNEVTVDANEAIQQIQHNKTLLVSKLTAEDPIQPEAISGLKTIEDVFRHFNPSVEVEMESLDGVTTKENVSFKNLGDFSPINITRQSSYLRNQSLKEQQYNKINKQLKVNKVLKSMLENEDTKGAVIDALKQLAQELENNR
nr:hypothetical protein [Pedobacter sp. ASV2]